MARRTSKKCPGNDGGPHDWQGTACAGDVCAWCQASRLDVEGIACDEDEGPSVEWSDADEDRPEGKPCARLHASLTVAGLHLHLTALRVRTVRGEQRAARAEHAEELDELYELASAGDPFQTCEDLAGHGGRWVIFATPAT